LPYDKFWHAGLPPRAFTAHSINKPLQRQGRQLRRMIKNQADSQLQDFRKLIVSVRCAVPRLSRTHRPGADDWRVILENTPMKMGILKNHRQKPTKRPKEKHCVVAIVK
jgi:hypothetical protein